jgi:transposase-like protein
MGSNFLTVARAAKSLKISEKRVRAMLDQGVLEGFESGGVTFVWRSSIDLWHVNQQPPNGTTDMTDASPNPVPAAPQRGGRPLPMPFSAEDDQYIIDHYDGTSATTERIATRLGRSPGSIQTRRSRLKTGRAESRARNAVPGAITPAPAPEPSVAAPAQRTSRVGTGVGRVCRKWTPEEDRRVLARSDSSKATYAALAAEFGRTLRAVAGRASDLAIMARTAAATAAPEVDPAPAPVAPTRLRRAGFRRWTPEEDEVLDGRADDSPATLAAIAARIGRSVHACELRISCRDGAPATPAADPAAPQRPVVVIRERPAAPARAAPAPLALPADPPRPAEMCWVSVGVRVEGTGAVADLVRAIVVKNIGAQVAEIRTNFGSACARVTAVRDEAA